MSGKSTIDQIRHYQRDIEKCPDNAERMLRCIHRLYILPITLQHLQETGVGRSVNALRKYKGEVGDAAKALVTKWKAMVAAEESGDENQDVSSNHVDEAPPAPPPVPVKHERKSDSQNSKEKNRNKEKSSSREPSNSNSKHVKKSISESRSHNSDSSKSLEKSSDSKPVKRSHSSSSNHSSEKHRKHDKNHKSHSEKKRKFDDEESSPPPEKIHKSHSSHSKERSSHSKKKEVSSESEEESNTSEESEADVSEESPERNSEDESEADSESSKSSDDSDSNSSSDHRHRSKHKSSHQNHKHSSHSKEKEKEKIKHKEKNNKLKEKDKNKENHSHNKHSDKNSSKKNHSSPDIKELIKENERKVKKERKEEFLSPSKSVPQKAVKLETNEDGSIDSGSGASFADALLVMDTYDKKKTRKSSTGSQKSSSKCSKSSSSCSSSNPSIKVEVNSFKSKPASSSSSKPKSIDELVEPPELLTKNVKLEALDIDFSSTLPEINPNYKPLPHVPERSRQVKVMSDEDHMFSMMTNKNQRTKVYSGNKAVLTSVPTLFSMCIQLLYENIDAVEYTGGVPFQLLKPLLEKLNADQLYVLEHFNPYLIEDTDDLWKFHCSKEFRTEKRQDMESWRELYVRCMDEREKKLKALTANITQSMAKSTPVRQAKLAYVDAVVKPPRNVARKQAKFGTGNASTSSSKNSSKHEIVSKAIVGGNTPGLTVKDTVPPPPPAARAAAHHPTPAFLKKKKAPLMQKALQVMKGTRYKR